MSATYKSVASMRELVDLLKKELAATLPVETDSFDANGNPVAEFSADATPAAGEKVVVIRMKAIGAIGATDSLGNTQNDFSHHVYQFCTEANPSSGSGADILTPVELLPLIVELGRRGSFVEWYQSTNGTVPSVAWIDAHSAVATWRPLYWNVLAAI
jgi:hypothetical protein